MVTLSVEEQDFKDMLKQALLELFEERRDLLHDLMIEALEDAGLNAAIHEGEVTANVNQLTKHGCSSTTRRTSLYASDISLPKWIKS